MVQLKKQSTGERYLVMNILIYSGAFWPLVGGIESVSETLAEGFMARGHQITVATATPAEQERSWSYPVVRNPGRTELLQLVKQANIVVSNGASLVPVLPCLLSRTPLVWIHQGYQVISIDGLGWSGDEPTPLAPLASVKFWAGKRGTAYALREGIKLYLRLFTARVLVYNVTCSKWMYERLGLKDPSIAIPNPINRELFMTCGDLSCEKEYDYVFLGRLVSEKGVGTFLQALNLLKSRDADVQTLVIGDGPERKKLEEFALSQGLNITFAGSVTGQDLVELIARSRVGVMPSIWEEAFGNVALELFAAGLPVVISKRSGAASFIDNEFWEFENGNVEALADRLWQIRVLYLKDPDDLNSRIETVKELIAGHDSVDAYLSFFSSISAGKA